MNKLEIDLIIANVYRNGGHREKSILDNLKTITLYRNDINYKIYRFLDFDNNYFEYDF